MQRDNIIPVIDTELEQDRLKVEHDTFLTRMGNKTLEDRLLAARQDKRSFLQFLRGLITLTSPIFSLENHVGYGYLHPNKIMGIGLTNPNLLSCTTNANKRARDFYLRGLKPIFPANEIPDRLSLFHMTFAYALYNKLFNELVELEKKPVDSQEKTTTPKKQNLMTTGKINKLSADLNAKINEISHEIYVSQYNEDAHYRLGADYGGYVLNLLIHSGYIRFLTEKIKEKYTVRSYKAKKLAKKSIIAMNQLHPLIDQYLQKAIRFEQSNFCVLTSMLGCLEDGRTLDFLLEAFLHKPEIIHSAYYDTCVPNIVRSTQPSTSSSTTNTEDTVYSEQETSTDKETANAQAITYATIAEEENAACQECLSMMDKAAQKDKLADLTPSSRLDLFLPLSSSSVLNFCFFAPTRNESALPSHAAPSYLPSQASSHSNQSSTRALGKRKEM